MSTKYRVPLCNMKTGKIEHVMVELTDAERRDDERFHIERKAHAPRGWFVPIAEVECITVH